MRLTPMSSCKGYSGSNAAVARNTGHGITDIQLRKVGAGSTEHLSGQSRHGGFCTRDCTPHSSNAGSCLCGCLRGRHSCLHAGALCNPFTVKLIAATSCALRFAVLERKYRSCMADKEWACCGNVLAGRCWRQALRRRLHCLRPQAHFSTPLCQQLLSSNVAKTGIRRHRGGVRTCRKQRDLNGDSELGLCTGLGQIPVGQRLRERQ